MQTSRFQSIGLALLLLVLLSAVGLQLWGGVGESRTEVRKVGLATTLPASPAGWSVEDLPLGDTEARDASAAKMLNLDEYVLRRYSRGRDSITVYLAYWGPGRMDTRLVASHTPDRCWTENGWRCESVEHQVSVETANGAVTKPAEYRSFDYSGHTEYVYFWQLVNGEPYDFGERLNKIPDPYRFTRDFLRQMRRGKPEQYFIRINSTLTPDALQGEPLFTDIVKSLAGFGLLAKEP